MNRSSIILKPYLKKLVLQTHPDFFQFDTLRKKTNAESLQKLNELLQLSHTKRKSVPVKLEFYSKSQRKSKAPTAVGLFDTHDSEWVKAQIFFQLCQQLDIPILQSDLDAVQDMIQKETKPTMNKSLAKEFAEKLYQQHRQPKIEWQSEDVLRNNMIMFGPLVDTEVVAKKLSTWLPQLQPEKWWGKIPVLILSSQFELPAETGSKDMLILKSDMGLRDIEEYLNTHLDKVLKEIDAKKV
ncbi:uncharacterized protein B0P05DRAFT_590038 [Gilbertella persicaria]|uniref:uncharacterized protein n=1 Tax=Gilbertella persicaria TaxID=101096 RepID=UPI00221F0B3C|nr:uncharacterized protein B0P05DRAFT_590038 [Gilbertella persicaria]KAI8064834.1 hypothetical protein B0P05DRAFT_590038 [Gilbertella persicaria]